MGESVVLHENSFNGSVAKGNWIVDFWADWCGPCKIMAPHFDEAAKELKQHVAFGKVDVEKNYELAQQFEIMSIPTVMFFKNGEVVHSHSGALSKEQILSLAKEVF